MFSIALDDGLFDVAPQEMISSWQIWTSGWPLPGSAISATPCQQFLQESGELQVLRLAMYTAIL